MTVQNERIIATIIIKSKELPRSKRIEVIAELCAIRATYLRHNGYTIELALLDLYNRVLEFLQHESFSMVA